jgi:hypothetical protein
MREDVKNVLSGLSYDELLEVGTLLTDLKKGARADAKAEATATQEATVARVNGLIASGSLKLGSEILVSYKNKVVNATVKTVPTEKAKNLRLYSESFDGETHERYADKFRFVDLA